MVQLKSSKPTPAGRIGSHDIYESLKEQISEGVFGETGRLPSSRGLAQELGVSRTTVMIAFEQLDAEGFIELRQGTRPRVVKAAVGRPNHEKQIHDPETVRLSSYGARLRSFSPWSVASPGKILMDFRHGDLAGTDFPSTAWRKAVAEAASRRPDRLSYANPRGSTRLRMALQGYLWRARTIRCDLNQIIIVNGSQQGLDLCARVLLDPDDCFVIENPCYDMARQIFTGVGASAIPVKVDRNGMVTERLEHLEARLAYVTPSHQFPLGGILPVSRRHQLLDWSRKFDAYVVEDDYDSEFRFDINPVPPLFSLKDGSNVIYLGTVSKTLAPGLRIGYLVVPAELQDVFAKAKLLTDRHAPLLQQEALASLVESGIYERHLRRIRRSNHERRAILLNALRYRLGNRIEIEGADAGLHVVVWLNDIPRSREASLVERARAKGLGIYPISPLFEANAIENLSDRSGLVLGYSALGIKEIERGVHILADLVEKISGDHS
ncbi:PLP-dependent aminotransferase family protein [Agrobacterium rhizogenes]|nr:PLP-dependent aminotransferase family protein [Rhizobium rhizogenes]NTJ78883.1 PLP-dependent aminotransferase family protein [Rhizobium rhizogenes]